LDSLQVFVRKKEKSRKGSGSLFYCFAELGRQMGPDYLA